MPDRRTKNLTFNLSHLFAHCHGHLGGRLFFCSMPICSSCGNSLISIQDGNGDRGTQKRSTRKNRETRIWFPPRFHTPQKGPPLPSLPCFGELSLFGRPVGFVPTWEPLFGLVLNRCCAQGRLPASRTTQVSGETKSAFRLTFPPFPRAQEALQPQKSDPKPQKSTCAIFGSFPLVRRPKMWHSFR